MLTLEQDFSLEDELPLAQHYLRDIAPYKGWSDEQIVVVTLQAQQGNTQARDDLILSVLNYVEYWASRFVHAYFWSCPRLEYLDLVGVGNVEVVERVDEALTKECPWAYLASRAKYIMWNYCKRYRSLIVTPSHQPAYHVESLDAPLHDETESTLVDVIAAPEPVRWYASLDISEERLYEALKRLGQRQQDILKRLFGLDVHTPERLAEVSKGYAKQTVQLLREGAVETLRKILTSEHAEVYSFSQACEVLKVSEQRMYALIRKHHLTRVIKGYYPKAQVDALLPLQASASSPVKKAARPTETPAKQPRSPEVYTLAQVCSLLGVNKQRFYHLRRKYGIPIVAKGCYPKQDIHALLEHEGVCVS